jgi:hypothetical protein
MPFRRVADILATKPLAPASQHLAKPSRDRLGAYALTYAYVPTRGQKIDAVADT